MKLFRFFKTKKDELLFIISLIGAGWGAYSSINIAVKAEGQEIKKEVNEIRSIDMNHINGRFDRIEKRFDKLEEIIRDVK